MNALAEKIISGEPLNDAEKIEALIALLGIKELPTVLLALMAPKA